MRAADELGGIVQSYESDHGSSPTRVPMLKYLGGWNMLTGSLVLRITNVGVWLAAACGLIWAGVVWFQSRRTKPNTRDAPDDAECNRSAKAARWLVGTGWSCLWLGLASLALHAWCTLAMAYCVNRIMAVD